MLTIHTDGGNSAKNSVGGCAAVVSQDNMILAELVETYEGDKVTNNTMELAGVLLAGQYMLDHPELGREVTIVSDSEYVVKGASEWLPKWQLRGWKGTTGPVKNRELWESIALLKQHLDIKFKWCRGHGDTILNNRADEILVKAYTKLIKKKKP